MNAILLAACFLFIFCHGPRHKPVAKSSSVETKSPVDANGFKNAKGKNCEQITKGFDSWGNSDDWVSEFPVDQQHRVLVCLDKLAKRQGEQ